MAKLRSPVHKPDVMRAFAAAKAAGVPNPRVEIICPNGITIAISGGKPSDPADGGNEWDEVLTDDPPAD